MIYRSAILLSILVTVLTACGPAPIFHEEWDNDTGIWVVADTVPFAVELADTNRLLDLSLNIRHEADFAFQNVYVKVLTGFPDGNIRDQVLSLEMADKTGAWHGDCSGETCETEVLLSEGIRVPVPGKYSFRFVQYSRMDSLQGIYGLAFEVRDHADAK